MRSSGVEKLLIKLAGLNLFVDEDREYADGLYFSLISHSFSFVSEDGATQIPRWLKADY